MKESYKIYQSSKLGIITKFYSSQKISSRKRGHSNPSYTKQELKNWVLSQDLFHELYKMWENSGYEKDLKPSIDRKNDYKGYSFDNIQLMTWGENREKGSLYRKNGKNNKINKAVIQFDIDGNNIAEYYSMRSASRITGIQYQNIQRAVSINSKYNKAGGYVWKSKEL